MSDYSVYYFTPPYFMLLAGLLVSFTCGLAFQATLKELVLEWSRSRSTRTLAKLRGIGLSLPFLGLCVGSCTFLASGLQLFSFSPRLAYTIALPLTIASGLLIWYQLGRILIQLEQGGSKALDLDSLV